MSRPGGTCPGGCLHVRPEEGCGGHMCTTPAIRCPVLPTANPDIIRLAQTSSAASSTLASDRLNDLRGGFNEAKIKLHRPND